MSRPNYSRILRIMNVKFSGYMFMKTNIYGDFQICISLPLRTAKNALMPEPTKSAKNEQNMQRHQIIK